VLNTCTAQGPAHLEPQGMANSAFTREPGWTPALGTSSTYSHSESSQVLARPSQSVTPAAPAPPVPTGISKQVQGLTRHQGSIPWLPTRCQFPALSPVPIPTG
jgi:hypothetical protein